MCHHDRRRGNPSVGVKVLVRDQFGNPVRTGKTVTVGVTPAFTGLATSPTIQTNNSGIATFKDNVIIPGTGLGDRQLSAQVTDGATQVPRDSGHFRLVNDLKACGNTKCETKFGVTNQNFINVINAGDGQFDTGGRDVHPAVAGPGHH